MPLTLSPSIPSIFSVLWSESWDSRLQTSISRTLRSLFFGISQGQKVAELILHHAQANDCRDVESFKAEMATLVSQAREKTITLEKVSRPPEPDKCLLFSSEHMLGPKVSKVPSFKLILGVHILGLAGEHAVGWGLLFPGSL